MLQLEEENKHMNTTASRFWPVVSTFGQEQPEAPPYPASTQRANS